MACNYKNSLETEYKNSRTKVVHSGNHQTWSQYHEREKQDLRSASW